MKQFFKFVFASMVGFLFSSIIIIIVIVLIIAGLVAAGSDKTVEVEPDSVLKIAFNYPVTERTPNNPLSALSFLGIDGDKSIGLNDILANIKKAKTDSNIKGIFLEESMITPPEATSEEVRNALIDFKKSGKFI